jgi:L-rhamnonate dehydratase
MNSDPGVPLAEAAKLPGVAVPVNGRLVPSDAPGFGIDLKEEQLIRW